MIEETSRLTANSMAAYGRHIKPVRALDHAFTGFSRGVTVPRGIDRRR
jgi:hypothetical protein